MAPTGLQADNHIIRHWGCQKVGHVGQDMGAAPGRGTGPPDRPIRASPGMGSLAGSWYRGLSVTVPTRVTQGKSLHVPLGFRIYKTPVPPIGLTRITSAAESITNSTLWGHDLGFYHTYSALVPCSPKPTSPPPTPPLGPTHPSHLWGLVSQVRYPLSSLNFLSSPKCKLS